MVYTNVENTDFVYHTTYALFFCRIYVISDSEYGYKQHQVIQFKTKLRKIEYKYVVGKCTMICETSRQYYNNNNNLINRELIFFYPFFP